MKEQREINHVSCFMEELDNNELGVSKSFFLVGVT